MLFPTVTFAIFFMIVLPVSWLLMPKPARWKLFMLAASYYFYGYWNWRFILLLVVSTLGNQLFARLIHRSDDDRLRRIFLGAAVAMNLGVLGYFKYYDFFVSSAQNMLRDVGISVAPDLVAVTLPVGISFFTFQALSYVIDVYRRKSKLLDELATAAGRDGADIERSVASSPAFSSGFDRRSADEFVDAGVTLFTVEIVPSDGSYDLTPLQQVVSWRNTLR